VLALLARLPLNGEHPPQQLMDESRKALEDGSTPVLVSPGDIQLGLSDTVRSGLLLISSRRDQAGRWFKFADEVNFDRCMPAEQEPRLGKDEVRRMKDEG